MIASYHDISYTMHLIAVGYSNRRSSRKGCRMPLPVSNACWLSLTVSVRAHAQWTWAGALTLRSLLLSGSAMCRRQPASTTSGS